MRKQLYDELISISGDTFHRLCDDILEYHNPEYKSLDARGMHLYKDKSVKGTPDSIKSFPDGSIYAFQYTTTGSGLKGKIFQDIEEVHNWEFAQNVRRIILCCNSRLNDEIRKGCKEKCFQYRWELDLIDIDSIISIILGSYDAKVKANKYFWFDTYSINLEEDLENYTMQRYPTLAGSEIIDNYHQKLR